MLGLLRMGFLVWMKRFIDVKAHARCKMVQLPWKTARWHLRTTRNYSMIQQFYFWACTQKNWRQGLQWALYTHVQTAALPTIAGWHEQPKCPSADKWWNQRWHVHTMEYYSAFERKEILPCDTGHNMGEPGDPYAEWNNLDSRRQTLRFHVCDITREAKFIELERRTVVARGWGERTMGTAGQFGKMKKFCRWTGVTICTLTNG